VEGPAVPKITQRIATRLLGSCLLIEISPSSCKRCNYTAMEPGRIGPKHWIGRLGRGRTERHFMKKNSNSRKATMDNIYFVSAADVADKIIDRMRRGCDPLLLADSSLAFLSLAPALRTRSRPKSD
jgi:hypothetical protein